MTSRVYFDQQVIRSNFASFSSNELFENKSIFSLLFSYFSKESDSDISSLNSSFNFACDQSGSFVVLCVSYSLFFIDLKTNKILNHVIPHSDSYCQSSIAISSESIAFLCNSQIHFFTHEFQKQKDPINLNKDIKPKKIFCLSNEFLILTTSNSIVKVYNFETVLTKLKSNYTITAYSNSHIALVGKKSIEIISENMTTITPKSDILNNPQDATFSTDGNLFFILDKNQPNKNAKSEDPSQINEVTSNLYVFDVSNGFSLTDTIEIHDNQVRYLVSWPTKHVVVYDDFGSLFFVSLTSHQTQQQPIKPQSVLRGTKNGFLLIELEDQFEETFSFNLLSFVSVTPQKLYERSCQQGFFGDALVLMRTFNFDKDIYYKSYVLKSPLTARLIDEELFMIEDQDWIYNFCCKTVVTDETAEIARMLIKAGLRVRPNDEELLRQKERLRIYTLIVKSSFSPDEWKDFRDCNIEAKVSLMAKQSLFQRVGIIFKNSTEITEKTKANIISMISPLVHPLKYADLITKDAASFRTRAIYIDDICGQTNLIVELMNIGARYIPELKEDLEKATEFDCYVNEFSSDFENVTSTVDSSLYMKYSDYVNVLNDDQRLLLFAKNSKSGIDLNKKLMNQAKTIVDRSLDSSLSYVMNEPLSNIDSSIVFPSLSMSERIAELRVILSNSRIDSKFLSKFCNEAISNYKYQFTYNVANAFLENWSNFVLTSDVLNFLKLAKYAAVYDKTLSFSPLNEIDSSVVINIALKIVKNPEKEWMQFYKFAKKLNLKSASGLKYSEKLNELNMSAMILMRKFDDIEITTPKERDIAIENVQKLINNAQSCDINDPLLSGSIQCLAMIPTDLKSNVVNSIFKSINLYQHIYKLDTFIKPAEVNESKDINDVIINIINSKQFTPTDPLVMEKVTKFCKLVKNVIKQIDGIDDKKINSKLAILCLKHSDESQNNECLLCGSELIDNADDEVRIRYLNEDRWINNEKKATICNDGIDKSDKSFLPSFIDYRVAMLKEKESIGTDNFSILNCIAKMKDFENSQKLFKFYFSFIKTENIDQLLKDFCSKSDSPFEFNKLVTKLKEEGIINDDQAEELSKFSEKLIDQTDNVDRQFELIVKAEKSGAKISDDTKLKVYTLHTLKEMNLDYKQTEINPQKVASFIIQSKSKLDSKSSEHIIELLHFWSELSLLKKFDENILFELILIVPQKSLIENRKVVSDAFNSEDAEMRFFKRSNDLLFAASSVYPNVARCALDADSISPEVIDLVIENGLTYKFADSKHFADILNRAKSKVQLAGIVRSLKENEMYEALGKLANISFGIPPQFATSKNAEEILKWIDKTIC
ncbi:hypothetical protein M9Y10_010310 [Tritrichomonas musculus]|uniref:RZZ complex subunit KNTC1/ROD C-terminal domain-containing protein n=1 Tax=Tritrichomonas musculus TaxID=1915356 RepID=A0ABR2ILK3_9EUKA